MGEKKMNFSFLPRRIYYSSFFRIFFSPIFFSNSFSKESLNADPRWR
jgi:hypothetical protein